MQLIDPDKIQQQLDAHANRALYIHLEMTTGAYAAHFDSSKHPAATFITNAKIQYEHAKISGTGPYRVGLKMADGWVYSEGLTHYEELETDRLIMAGHDSQGKLIVALQLSPAPF